MPLDIESQNRRRATISVIENPQPLLDYVATLSENLRNIGGPGAISQAHAGLLIRYVPDGVVLEKASLGAYLEIIANTEWASLEEIATTILDDLNNEVVPRWVHVGLSGPEDENGARHSVIMEDRQPDWENPDLLARLSLT
jgi:7-cyano-7-deazaguanine reductase